MSNENIYQKARKEAALHNERLNSREQAAEMLGISPSTLANYELGVTKTIPPDAAVMMADLYKAPELKNFYCANECPIGRNMPIPTKISRIELVTVKAIKLLSTHFVEDLKTKLLEVSSNDKTAKDNLPTVSLVLAYLDLLIEALGELRLACQKLLSTGGINIK